MIFLNFRHASVLVGSILYIIGGNDCVAGGKTRDVVIFSLEENGSQNPILLTNQLPNGLYIQNIRFAFANAKTTMYMHITLNTLLQTWLAVALPADWRSEDMEYFVLAQKIHSMETEESCSCRSPYTRKEKQNGSNCQK